MKRSRFPESENLLDPIDILLAMAEIAIAILGFGGVVAAFASAPEYGSKELFSTRLAGLLGSAMNALMLSLLPVYFAAGDAPVPWGGLSCLQAVELFSFSTVFAYLWYQNPYGNPVIGALGVGGTATLGGFQLYNFLYAGTFQAYFSGLLWQTLLPAFLFARMAQVVLTAHRAKREPLEEREDPASR